MSSYFQVIFFSLVGGVFSLIGGFLLLSRRKTAETLAKIATPFAAGALLAATFFELISESTHDLSIDDASLWILAGVVGFFVLEYFFHWFHHHKHDHKHSGSPGPLLILGDTLHNLVDGIAIGAAFLIDPSTGIVTAIAIAAHEIPQEIGDFGLLLKFGYSKKSVITVNVVSALAATVGAVVTFALGSEVDVPTSPLIALTAGMFIYIAASDLIPMIHENAKKRFGHAAVALFILGLISIAVATTVAHEFLDEEHGHNHGSSHIEEAHEDHGDHEEDAHDHGVEEHEAEHDEHHDEAAPHEHEEHHDDEHHHEE